MSRPTIFLSVLLTILLTVTASYPEIATKQTSCKSVCEVFCNAMTNAEADPGEWNWGNWANKWKNQRKPIVNEPEGQRRCRTAGGHCMPIGWCGTAKHIQADCDRPSGQVCCFDI